MAMNQLELIKNQTQAVLRNKAAGSVARLRSETSLVSQASRLTGRMMHQADEMEETVRRGWKKETVPAAETTVRPQPQAQRPAPDGYVRRSPEQPICTSKDYYRKIVRKVVSGVVIGILAIGVIWLLLQTNLLAH